MKKKKEAKKTKKVKPEQKTEQKPIQDQENESGFDFGGFPARNLKKNLGCG